MNTTPDYATCTRTDLTRLLTTAHQEADAATTAIIHATEAATSSNTDQAIATLARYVLDNGHIREATDTTLGRLTVLTQPDTPRAGDLEEALNTWEGAWLEYADNYTGVPTRTHEVQATDDIRAAIAAGRPQGDILAAAQTAGTLFRADIAYFLARNAA